MSTYSRTSRRTELINGSATAHPYPRTPSRASAARTTSPTSTFSTATSGNPSKLNVVTRVAIEGKFRPSKETGAEVKMFLRIALPVESVTPGMTIPLFPEDNVRITLSQVHPLDQQSVPYAFSTTYHPLLHKAAKLLNLPAPSSVPYQSVFGSLRSDAPSMSRPTASSLGNSDDAAPLDVNYTGHVLVSGYQVCYILPKEFPPLQEHGGHSSRTPYKNRRSSLGEKHVLQFMAAIEMYIPYTSMPPRNPYLLSIPTPRCLQNSIKFRVISNKPVSASMASLSSVEEDVGWDFSADPIISPRKNSRLSRTESHYTDFADDESSDSSVTEKLVSCCQGSFQSTERIRIRWAKPPKSIPNFVGADDGWNRAGVDGVKGEMRCSVIGKGIASGRQDGREGIIMKVEYTGTCTGLWFPGVATLVGLDVGLEAKGSDVSWIDGQDTHWTVSGGHGFTGSNVGSRLPPSDTTSLATSTITEDNISTNPSHTTSYTSANSLLRAPLPNQSLAEYSFEGSTALTPSATLSSIGSLTPSSSAEASSGNVADRIKPPGSPVTIHVNMNEFIPPAKNSFVFKISGICLITPRYPHLTSASYREPASSSSNTESDMERNQNPLIALPRFTVLAAHSETTTTIIDNKLDSDLLKLVVYNPSGDISTDAQALKTVLQKGGSTTCNDDGGRITLRSAARHGIMHGHVNSIMRGTRRPTIPNSKLNGSTSLISSRAITASSAGRSGPLLIPYATATVTPLLLERGGGALLDSYAVRISLPVPLDPDCSYLEFGLAQIELESGPGGEPPNIDIASASVDGIPVRCEISVPKQDKDAGPQFEQMSGQEWLSWVTVHTQGLGGGSLVVDYVVHDVLHRQSPKSRWKGKSVDDLSMEVFLPAFALPVGRLEVLFDGVPGLEVASLRSNLVYQQSSISGGRLLHYSLDASYLPRLSVRIRPSRLRGSAPSLSSIFGFMVVLGLLAGSLATLSFLLGLGTEVEQLQRSLETYSLLRDAPEWRNHPEAVTVTTTAYTTHIASLQWCHNTSQQNYDTFVTAVAPAASVISTNIPDDKPQEVVSEVPDSGDGDWDSDRDGAPALLLLAYHKMVKWPLSLEKIDMSVALDKVAATVDVIWQVLRKIYHYPLDPP
ncbi:hypothetical protein PLEOSDRAFT_1073634 [Pleurotus ostreatus PC15]|uniref:Uncharacterized protein n=1 Tax=Pleurotus ostreatus (strain PC15) TaxID=1137138 RepID=A0A067NZR5_PLEO1|nr:hypothetical protein PLEOSDRAFT_1073634 [Pleurotus ostreatus PC15]